MVKTFNEFLSETAKIKPFGPDVFHNKKQMNAIVKNKDFQTFVSIGLKKVYARKDHDPFWDDTFWVSNSDQKYIIKYDLSRNGKVFGYTVFYHKKPNDKILDILKTVGEQ